MRRLYTYYIYMLLAALGLPGCDLIHDDDMDCQLYTPEGVPYAYVSIALSTAMNPSTRAADDPTGGEDGDGPEPGQANENQVNDITLFFYEATGDKTDKGVNSAAETKVIRQYFGNNDINYTTGQQASTNTVPVEELLVNHDYHVLAVVNGGESFGTNIQTLGDLQRETVKELYKVSETGGGTTYTNFLMASADDENQPLHIIPSNSETNPATTQIDVERVTARVDYRAEASYKVGTEGSEPIGTAKITGAMLVNTLNDDAASWLLKRVADRWGSTKVEYLGLETTDATTNAASNYVIDAKAEKVEADFTPATYFPNIGYDDLTWEDLFVEGSLVDGLEENYLCVGYPKENVNQTGQRDRTTGIVFRAVYTPDGMTEGDTFFEWGGVVYPTLEVMMEEEYSPSWDVISGRWNDVSTWEN